MEIEIISFGKISEFISHQKMTLTGPGSTDELKVYLEAQFPQLAAMKYKLALNKKIVQQNLEIKPQDTIAIMPPFSGG